MLSRWTAVLALAPFIFCTIRPVGAFWATWSTPLRSRDSAGFVRYDEAHRRIARCDMILKESNRVDRPAGDSDEASLSAEKRRKRLTAVRVGGRSVKKPQRSPIQRSQGNQLQRFFLPGLIGLLLIWSLGGSESNTYYYSYSSYSVETTTYQNNGVLDVRKKESADFRSNIPGLRNNPSMLSDLRQENQRLLKEQEQEYLDTFSSSTIRAIEEIFDESGE